MTTSQSDVETTEEGTDEAAEEAAADPLAAYAEEVAAAVGGEASVSFETIKVEVPPQGWVDALRTARDDFDLVLFSFLSAIDWSNDPAVGDAPAEELETEYFELIATVSDVTVGRRITFSTRLDHETPTISSLVDVYAGANWHEREAHEMFGIVFEGHPDLSHLYLPDGFLGNPLRKSFPLLSREVKPWPGKVDVENMPEDEDEDEDAGEGEGVDTDGEGGGEES